MPYFGVKINISPVLLSGKHGNTKASSTFLCIIARNAVHLIVTVKVRTEVKLSFTAGNTLQ